MDTRAKLFYAEHRVRGSSPRTIEGYQRDLDRFRTWLEAEGRSSAMGEIRRHDVLAFIEHLLTLPVTDRRPNPAGTAHMVFRTLRAFFNWAVEQDVIAPEESPMRRVKGPRVPEHRVPILGDDDIRRLLDTCRRGKRLEDRRDYALLRLFIDSGARLGEVLRLTLDDYDDTDGLLTIRQDTSKSRRTRTLSLSAETQLALGRWIALARPKFDMSDRTRAIWLGVKGPLTESGISQIVRRRSQAAGLAGVHPHQFRHSFAHHALRTGVSEGDVMRRGGWRSRAMLDRYGRAGASERSNDAFRASGFGDRW